MSGATRFSLGVSYLLYNHTYILILWLEYERNATTYPSVQPFKTVEDLVAYLADRLTKAVAKRGGSMPDIMVMGALGRCGSGAVDLSKRVGIPECVITLPH
jgi:hypothetical protein